MNKEEFKALNLLSKIRILSGAFDTNSVNDMANKLFIINVLVVAEIGGENEKAFMNQTIDKLFEGDASVEPAEVQGETAPQEVKVEETPTI